MSSDEHGGVDTAVQDFLRAIVVPDPEVVRRIADFTTPTRSDDEGQ